MSNSDPRNPDNIEPTGNETPPPAPGTLGDMPAGNVPPTDPAFTPPPDLSRQSTTYDTPPPPPPGPNPTPYTGQETYGAASTPGTATPVDDIASPSKDSRNWAMFAHLSALVVGLITSMFGAPFLSFLGPLVIYLMKKDESSFVADQAREALNFNITVNIVLLPLVLLTFTIILAIITVPLMLIVSVVALILSIIAAIKASNGEVYRYPFTLRLIN